MKTRTDRRQDRLARRSFLSRVSAGAAAFAAAFGAAPASAALSRVTGVEASVAPGVASGIAPGVAPGVADASGWMPARHAEDDWFDQTPAKHKLFMDTTEPDGFGQAIAWARNVFEASASGYGLADADTAIVICARHASTPFAYSDAMWAKYGATFSQRASAFVDPKSKQVPTVNVYLATGYGDVLKSNGILLDAVLKRGVRLAVCGMATRRIAGLIAQKSGEKADDIYKELTGNLVSNAHIVPAGIVAVSRAQERGYTLATVA